MTDEKLIRILLWQNGMLRGLLCQARAALLECGEQDSFCVDELVSAANELLKGPLPAFLENEVDQKKGEE